MEAERIQELIRKYNEGLTDPAENKRIEQLLEKGEIEISQLHELQALESQFMNAEFPMPSANLDDSFYQMLASMKKKSVGFSWNSFFSWPVLAPKLALAAVALIAGFFIGYWNQPSDKQQVEVLTQEVSDLKEMMMFSLLEKESATERLKAVSLTSEIATSSKVTGALLETLNHDENINVRLAALDALKPYARNSQVREELIKSIARQESPLVQIALAELMVALQEKSSVKEFEKIMKRKETPEDVKKEIAENIKTMI